VTSDRNDIRKKTEGKMDLSSISLDTK